MCHITTMGSNGQPVYTAATPAQKAAFESSDAGRQANVPSVANDRVTFSPEAAASLGGQ